MDRLVRGRRRDDAEPLDQGGMPSRQGHRHAAPGRPPGDPTRPDPRVRRTSARSSAAPDTVAQSSAARGSEVPYPGRSVATIAAPRRSVSSGSGRTGPNRGRHGKDDRTSARGPRGDGPPPGGRRRLTVSIMVRSVPAPGRRISRVRPARTRRTNREIRRPGAGTLRTISHRQRRRPPGGGPSPRGPRAAVLSSFVHAAPGSGLFDPDPDETERRGAAIIADRPAPDTGPPSRERPMIGRPCPAPPTTWPRSFARRGSGRVGSPGGRPGAAWRWPWRLGIPP